MIKYINPKNIYRLFKTSKRYYLTGKSFLTDPIYQETQNKIEAEISKNPSRTEIINDLLSVLNRETSYLEIGVRNPDDNFNRINASVKYSVDPGIEFDANPVDFKVTSDTFFNKLRKNEILSSGIRFDLIFIDGLYHFTY